MLAVLSTALFASLMILAGTGDVLSRRIGNRLVLLIAVGFFPLALADGLPFSAILMHTAVGLMVLLAGFVLFSFGVLGGGDAKLLGAAAIWFGPEGLPHFLIMTTLAGGILGLAVLAWSFISFELQFRERGPSHLLSSVRPSVPYGFAIAAGAILAVPGSWLAPAAAM